MTRNRPFTITVLTLGLVFLAAPLVFVVINSFNDSSYGAWPPPGFGLRWYRRLFEQDGLLPAALASLWIAALAAAIALAVGTAAAVSLTRFRYPGRGLVDALLMAPLIVPKVAIGLGAFILILKAGGYGQMFPLVGLHVILLIPFAINIIGGALVRIPRVYEQAARDLGAGPVRAFVLATLPQLRTSLGAAFALCFMISFDEVDATVFVVAPNQDTLPVWMYQYMQQYQDPTVAALSTILIALSTLLVVVLVSRARTTIVAGLGGGAAR
ncbi:ABC transporter permease subunit [Nakamurella sp. YIM 132087]|uniref:ABC transporter permease subunit n=1 Tax=Nakamurella alba TaxID=2665158 RepID=A0A7K1FPP9_9ACTN|nr:ABC transporter permease [Nakamurella alba]MTD15213.1 ABC transporter permease subunit [Nakamurella alba]